MISWDIIKTKILSSNNEEITIARLNLDNSIKSHNKLVHEYIPKISFKSQYIYKPEKQYINHFDILFEDLFDLHKYISKKKAYIDIKIKKNIYKRTVSNTIYAARKIYIDLMYTYDSIELLEKIKKQMNTNMNILNLKYKSGLIDLIYLKKIEADILKTNYEINKLKRHIKTISKKLKNITEEKSEEVYIPTEKLTGKELIHKSNYNDTDNVIIDSPEFVIAKNELKKTKLLKLKYKNRFIPKISVNYRIPLFNVEKYMLGVSAEYFILDGLKSLNERKINTNNLKIAKNELKKTIKSLHEKSTEYCTNIIDAYDDIKINENYLDILKLQSEISLKKYLNGVIDFDTWYKNEEEYFDYQIKNINVKKNFCLLIAEWENFIGTYYNENK
ncbi:MAG: TolC family protein [Endomicrobium sp.]|nr:TolC family protein [Endomicrobium sp.]